MIEITYKHKIYKEKLFEAINGNETVIELGAHIGNTSKLILNRLNNGKLIGLDNSPEAIEPMKNLEKEYGNFKFIYGDARLHNSLESVYKLTQSCDILSIDLGGGYHPDTVFKVFYLYSSALKPKYTIIRNRGLIDFVNSAKTYEDFKSYSGSIESQRESGIPPQIKQMEEFKLWSSKLDK